MQLKMQSQLEDVSASCKEQKKAIDTLKAELQSSKKEVASQQKAAQAADRGFMSKFQEIKNKLAAETSRARYVLWLRRLL
jgi:capsule polysaccharide export protein KpsE/RkpR